MSKSVLISIRPEWCEKIISGKKTVEIRKTKPKLETPFKCYIYETKGKLQRYSSIAWEIEGKGKVIGEFICDEIINLGVACEVHDELPSRPCEYWLEWDTDNHNIPDEACLSAKEIMSYLGKSDYGYAWHISDLVIYEEPRELRDFHLPCTPDCVGYCEIGCVRLLKRPPQSWCYVERVKK